MGTGTDCNDLNPNVFPGHQEDCKDGTDNDCNGSVDEDAPNCEDIQMRITPLLALLLVTGCARNSGAAEEETRVRDTSLTPSDTLAPDDTEVLVVIIPPAALSEDGDTPCISSQKSGSKGHPAPPVHI